MPGNQNDSKGVGENRPSRGNASNPSPHNPLERDNDDHLLNRKAEKYIREAANIEDVPDAQDQQDMDETLKETGKNSEQLD
jgi:hypothetical protein